MSKLHDSLSKTLKDFPPNTEGPATIYACGPTVYHYIHIGNLRTFAVTDLLRRYLEYRGRQVKLIMNITDVGHMLNDADDGEDKMEKAASKEGKTPEEIAAFYTAAFFKDIDAIGIKRAERYPKATEHIPEMVALIEKLIAAEKAYVTPKGDIYYSVASFPDYGKLSGNTVEALQAGARVEVKEDKRHPADFALWINNPDHVMQWTGPQGIQGYPGWHIECSAMAMKYLGETIDLHVGGEDLKFPHHECEIAQSEGANGKAFARHWLHVSYLLVEGEKMSKSKGNFYTLSDLLEKGHSAEAVRFLLLSAHYRTQLNFTLEGLKSSEKTVEKMREVAAKFPGGPASHGRHEAALQEAMDEDLNVSAALAVVHDFMAEANKGAIPAAEGAGFMKAVDDLFGLGLFTGKGLEVPAEVSELVASREKARLGKEWAESDRLRGEIEKRGFTVKDTPDGPKIGKA
jgi:cysteinyl-tRNA synthetase